MTRTCKICGADSDNVEFYKGINCRCKECHKEQVRLNRREKIEQYAAYEKMRFKRDPWRTEYNKAKAKTPEYRAARNEAVRRRNAMHPDKRAANIMVCNAVRDGRLIKPRECSRCGGTPPRRQLHGHHADYSKPLEVEWICSGCHGLEHFGEAPDAPSKNRVRGRYVARIIPDGEPPE